jgi:hypothetical protein
LAGSREQGKRQNYRLWPPERPGGRLLVVVINRIR